MVDTMLSPLQGFLYFMLTTTVQIKYFNYSHFMDKETEWRHIKVK